MVQRIAMACAQVLVAVAILIAIAASARLAVQVCPSWVPAWLAAVGGAMFAPFLFFWSPIHAGAAYGMSAMLVEAAVVWGPWLLAAALAAISALPGAPRAASSLP